MKCLRFLLLGSFAVAFVLGFSWNSLQARIVPILNFNSDLAFIVSENEFTLDDYYDDTISLFSEFDTDYDVDMYLEAEMQLGLLWKGEGLLDIFSFFAIYHIELIGSGFDWSQKIPFKKYNEVITADQVTSNFNEYVLTSIDNAIRGTYLQPYFNYRPRQFLFEQSWVGWIWTLSRWGTGYDVGILLPVFSFTFRCGQHQPHRFV